MKTDIVVIGSGPGGYVAAIRAAQRDASVVLIEKEKIGGVCLNVGCIPTKALFKNAAFMKDIKNSKALGIEVNDFTVDFDQIMKRKNGIVNKLTSGVKLLLKNNGVQVINGTAEIVGPNQVVYVEINGRKDVIECNQIIIATGSTPIKPPIKGLDLNGVMTSKELLSIEKLPKSLAIIGGGVIGMEFASIFNMLGTEVYVVERLPKILPNIDEEVSNALKSELEKRNINIQVGTELQEISSIGEKLLLTTSKGEIQVEKVLVSVGRRPVLPEIKGLDLEIERGALVVNDYLQTNVPNIYCIGDANGKMQLAHVASAQAIVAIDHILMDHAEKMSYKSIPSVVYCLPEIASVGLTEEEARKKTQIKVGKFNYYGNGKALCMGEVIGFAKVITDAKYNEILGVHIFGYDASNLIGEAGLALNLEATAEEVAKTIHAHPSISEIIMECCEDIEFKSIHI